MEGFGPAQRKFSEHFHWKHQNREDCLGLGLHLPEGAGKNRAGGSQSRVSVPPGAPLLINDMELSTH